MKLKRMVRLELDMKLHIPRDIYSSNGKYSPFSLKFDIQNEIEYDGYAWIRHYITNIQGYIFFKKASIPHSH